MLALFPKVPKTQRQKALKIDVFDNPTVDGVPSSGNPKNIHIKLHCEKLESLGYIFVTILWVYLRANFRRRLLKTHVLCNGVIGVYIMAVHGHPRSLILVPIESAYTTSY